MIPARGRRVLSALNGLDEFMPAAAVAQVGDPYSLSLLRYFFTFISSPLFLPLCALNQRRASSLPQFTMYPCVPAVHDNLSFREIG